MDSRFLIILGILVLVAVLEIVVLMTADSRRRALAEAGPSQGFQPVPPGNPPKIALVPILEHKYHTWGEVLQESRGSSEVRRCDDSYSVDRSGSNQTVVAFGESKA